MVEKLTRSRVPATHRAHLDPDLRREIRPRENGWRAVLGQTGQAQGHLRNQGVASGDLFVFWGVFRPVDGSWRRHQPDVNVIWGWMQVGAIASVDEVVRPGPSSEWSWAKDHPHLAEVPFPDASNTIYIAADDLVLDGTVHRQRGSGVFETFDASRQLSASGARASIRPGLRRVPGGARVGGETRATPAMSTRTMNLEPDAALVVTELRLAPHPEGGFYRETFRSPVRVPTPRGNRAAMTVIYFLLPVGAASAFHRVLSDEVWVHSGGGATEIHTVGPDGVHAVVVLDQGGQVIVPAGHWQAARPLRTKYSLVTCVVAPGFEFEDFEIARRVELASAFPALPDDVLALAAP